MNRVTIKIAGESGMGLVSVGAILSQTLKRDGYFLCMDREYPSLIKGGHSNLQLDFDIKPVRALRKKVDIVVALDKAGIESYINVLNSGGILIHGYERKDKIKDLESKAEANGVKLLYLPARQIVYSLGGSELQVNMVLLGMLWRTLGFDLTDLKKSVSLRFSEKKKALEINVRALEIGYKGEFEELTVDFPKVSVGQPQPDENRLLLDGNTAIALGAINAGCRAYFAYPMSPASTILTHIANFAKETEMVIKQAEDEITAVQMCIGANFMGTRSFTATSGGGFDLMTESVSLAGMTEVPLVVVVAQRPGPATGLPTWTAQADLNLAIYSGHGEYAKIVLACSDVESCFTHIQHAFNLAEKYQAVVILLTEKVIAETHSVVSNFDLNSISIERGIVRDEELPTLSQADRFRFTDSGVSKRWLPGSCETYYFDNGDEHDEEGRLTEESGPCAKMYEKRMRKVQTIRNELPEPCLYGHKSGAKISFVGWGSTKNAMLDIIAENPDVNYLHYDFVYPIKTKNLIQFLKENENVHLIEGNYQGQLGELLKSALQDEGVLFDFKKRLMKYDGRPFFIEDITEYISKNM